MNGKAYALYPDVGDHQIGALGSLMREGDDVQLNIGTGGMAGRIVRGFSRAEGCEARPLLGDLYIQTITGLPGGRHLQVVMDFLRDAARMLTGQDIADDKLWSYAAAVDAKDVSLSVVPDFFGPRGGIIGGIGGGNFSPDSLIGAMYFAVARACASAVAALGGAKRLVYTGGAVTRNAGLRRAIEKACGIPGILPHGGDGAMMGHLRLALCLQGVPLDRSGETLAAAYAM